MSLIKRQMDLKLDMKNNQKNYEKIIDQAADEISNFVNSANFENYLKNFVNKSIIRKKFFN